MDDMGTIWATVGVFIFCGIVVFLVIRFPPTAPLPDPAPPQVLLKITWNGYGNQRLYVSGFEVNEEGVPSKRDYGYYDIIKREVGHKDEAALTAYGRQIIKDAIVVHRFQKGQVKTLVEGEDLKVLQEGQLVATKYKRNGQHKYYVDQYISNEVKEMGVIDLHAAGLITVHLPEHKELLTTLGIFLLKQEGQTDPLPVIMSATHTDLPGSQLQHKFQNSFEIGALGEAYIGGILTALYPGQAYHGLKLPKQGGDIDHLLICTKGVFVINTKTHSQKVVTSTERGGQ